MRRLQINLLIVNDDDMNCSSSGGKIKNMSLEDIGLSDIVLKDYNMIVYEGKKGSKILKSEDIRKGIII